MLLVIALCFICIVLPLYLAEQRNQALQEAEERVRKAEERARKAEERARKAEAQLRSAGNNAVLFSEEEGGEAEDGEAEEDEAGDSEAECDAEEFSEVEVLPQGHRRTVRRVRHIDASDPELDSLIDAEIEHRFFAGDPELFDKARLYDPAFRQWNPRTGARGPSPTFRSRVSPPRPYHRGGYHGGYGGGYHGGYHGGGYGGGPHGGYHGR